jgi:hypothetical protein
LIRYDMAHHLQELIDVCTAVQRALSAETHRSAKPIVVSADVSIHFPGHTESLARIANVTSHPTWSQHVATTTTRYLEACHRLQIATQRDYNMFCQKAESLEHLGGPADFELQTTVARSFSRWYAEAEQKLADVVLSRVGVNTCRRQRETQVIRHDEVSWYGMRVDPLLALTRDLI